MASGATYFIKFQSEGAAAVANGGGSPAVPGDMPAEIQAGLKNVQREIQNRVPPLTGFFKQMGIEVSLKSMLKQSQIFTSYVGSLFQIFGAMVDVMLAPLMPILIPAMQWLASKVPVVAEWAQRKIDRLVEILTPMWNWLRTVFAGGWESGMEILSQKMQGWMDDHGLGFAKGLVAGLTEWMGDHPGWSAIGGVIALAMMRKLTFKIAPLAIGLGWGALKGLATPGLATGAKGAHAAAGAGDDLRKGSKLGNFGKGMSGLGMKIAAWGGFTQGEILSGSSPSKLAKLTKEAKDYALGFRNIAGSGRVNIFTKTGQKALGTLGKAGQIFAMAGGAYNITKEWLADRHERDAMAAAIKAAIASGDLPADTYLPSPESQTWLKSAAGATEVLFGKTRSVPMMLALLGPMVAFGAQYAGQQDMLNKEFQKLTPDVLNDPNKLQNWMGTWMNKMSSSLGLEFGISGFDPDKDKNLNYFDYFQLGSQLSSGSAGIIHSGQLPGKHPWVPGGEVRDNNVTFTVQIGGPMGFGPEQHYQMSYSESFQHYTELINAGHRVEVDASNVGQ